MEIEKKIFGLRERLGYDFFFLEERWKKMNNVLLGFISPNFSSLSLKKILMVALLFLFFFFFCQHCFYNSLIQLQSHQFYHFLFNCLVPQKLYFILNSFFFFTLAHLSILLLILIFFFLFSFFWILVFLRKPKLTSIS